MSGPALDLFWAYLQDLDRAAGTIAQYRIGLKQFFTWFTETTGYIEPGAVTPLDIRQYRDYLAQDHKPATVNKKLSELLVFFTWASNTGQVATNPVIRIKRIEAVKKAPKWLTRPETYKVLRLAQQEYQMAKSRFGPLRQLVAGRTLAIITLLLSTGLRVSELCDLKPADVQAGERSGLVIVRKGKGSKYREIPLNADGRQAVKTWLAMREPGEYLFNVNGRRLDRQLVNWHLKRIGAKAGVRLTPHVLRHTFGKNLIDAGEPLDRVAMLLGHTDINTTAIYTLPSLQDLGKAVDKISWSD